VLADVQGRRPTHRAHTRVETFLRTGRTPSLDHG